MGWVLRRIDNIRDGYAAIVRRLVRVSVFGVVAILASAAAIYFLSLRTPTGFLPEEDQGAFFIIGAIAGRRIGHPHPRSGSAHRGRPEADAAGPEYFRDRRLLDHRRRQRAEYGVHRPDIEAVRRPRRCGQLGAGADRAGVRRGAADPHRDRHPVQPAADHRAVDDRRVRISARRAGRAGPGGDEQRDAGASRRRQPGPAADPRLFHLHRQQPVDLISTSTARRRRRWASA